MRNYGYAVACSRNDGLRRPDRLLGGRPRHPRSSVLGKKGLGQSADAVASAASAFLRSPMSVFRAASLLIPATFRRSGHVQQRETTR